MKRREDTRKEPPPPLGKENAMKKWIFTVLILVLVCSCVAAPAEGKIDSPVPAFNAADYPEVKPIDPSNVEAAKKQMEAYCRALLACPVIGFDLSDAPAGFTYEETYYGEPIFTVHLYSKQHEEAAVLLRLDGSVRYLEVPNDSSKRFDQENAWLEPEEVDEVFTRKLWEDASAFFERFSDAVMPGSGERIEKVVSWGGTRLEDGMYLNLFGAPAEYTDPNRDGPDIMFEVYPEFRVVEYGGNQTLASPTKRAFFIAWLPGTPQKIRGRPRCRRR